ncbi:uncharacterized protein LOC26527551 [Drosophila mojavensis]|uniref:Uncharacterized protein n=1 Tax=Drosophila mojavensis TaxID=7230 RepID=A0A0Q9XIJ9_DROMO|nr:uncharacterized protein LOC26527551 [Drosophila mojavensis]KRG03592.1 uncharacterized protein Dmoj_GI25910 [Drosophila mojavensis]
MHRFLGIFYCWIFLQNANFTEPLVKTPTNKLKTLQHLIMEPSNNLSLAQKESMQASCKKVHQRCLYAEECCTQQCVKRYKRCTHFWP